MAENPWRWWLQDEPRAAFEALRPQQGTNSFQNFWQGQFGRLDNRFQGLLGEQALAGEAPSLDFADWLTDFNWMDEWLKMSPTRRDAGRGGQPGRIRWVV